MDRYRPKWEAQQDLGFRLGRPGAIDALVVIVFVPVALRAPAMLVLVPPLMTLSPAALASLMQFAALVICLGAVSPVFLDGLVQLMLGVSHPPLASIVIFGLKAWNRGEQQCSR
jgi:hypothetical protein